MEINAVRFFGGNLGSFKRGDGFTGEVHVFKHRLEVVGEARAAFY